MMKGIRGLLEKDFRLFFRQGGNLFPLEHLCRVERVDVLVGQCDGRLQFDADLLSRFGDFRLAHLQGVQPYLVEFLFIHSHGLVAFKLEAVQYFEYRLPQRFRLESRPFQ